MTGVLKIIAITSLSLDQQDESYYKKRITKCHNYYPGVIMKSFKKRLAVKVVKVFVPCLVLLLGLAQGAFALQAGDQAPEIMGRKTKGGLFKLSAERGKYIVVNFFSTICKPCREEMPELAALEQKFPKVLFVSVLAEDKELEDVNDFISKIPLVPQTVICGSAMVKSDYRFLGFPHTVVLDVKGKVVVQYIGYTPENMKQLEKVLSGL